MPPSDGLWPTPSVHCVTAPPTAWSQREHVVTHLTIPQQFHSYGEAYSYGGFIEHDQIPHTSLHSNEGSSLPGYASPNDSINSESVAKVTPGDSGVVIG